MWAFAEKLNKDQTQCLVKVKGEICGQVLQCADGNTTSIIGHIKNTHSDSMESKSLVIKLKEASEAKKKKKEEELRRNPQRPIEAFLMVKTED